MSTVMAFVLGLLAGWIIEWIIDWIYWRGRASSTSQQEAILQERLKAAEAKNADLEHQLSVQKANQASLQEKLSFVEADLNAAKAELEAKSQTAPYGSAGESPVADTTPVRAMPALGIQDDLEVIKGIGPVIAKKLNDVGICSFADLAALTPERLRELVGDVISRLADEESIILQAKQLAEKSQGR